MNKKGFTVVELITSFALASGIIVLLINVLLILRETYVKTGVKTELLINQANLSNAINSKINRNNMTSYTTCTDATFCYQFTLADASTIKLIINGDMIKFGNYTYKLLPGTTVENPSVGKKYVNESLPDENTSFLVIKIPIKSKLYPNDDFGVNVVYISGVA